MGGGFDQDPGKHNAAREKDSKATTLSPGKRTLTEAVGVQLSASASGAAPTNRTDPGAIQQAAQGPVGGDATLPHSETIQRLFGHRGADAFANATQGAGSEVPYRADMERSFGQGFGSVRAHLGGHATAGLDALNARAATKGETIAFESASPSRELVAHELTHVVQQRQGGGAGLQAKGEVSDPSDAAEQEADLVASKVAAGERVSVGASAAAAIHRDIKNPAAKVPMGEFAIDMKKFDKRASDGYSGETGTVSFKPNDKAPDSTSIRLSQSIKYFDLSTKKDFDWTGSTEEDRGKMNTKAKDEKITTTADDTLATLSLRFYGTKDRVKEIYDANKATLKSDKPDDKVGVGMSLTVPRAVEDGFHVDHFPSDPKADPRKKKADKNVPQDYVWPGEENPPKNQHGSKAGKTIVAASLDDTPGWNKDMKYDFETVARSDDIGVYYGAMHWGFTIQKDKVVDEHHKVAEAPSQTFQAAVTEFNKFYKNEHTVMAGETLESISTRYFGDTKKAEDIYKANKAKIPDKSKLAMGTLLVLPGISPEK